MLLPIESFVRAEVNARHEDKPTLNFGAYRFVTLPRSGETVSIDFGKARYQLLVREVQHTGYSEEATPTAWDTMIVLICEIVDRAQDY